MEDLSKPESSGKEILRLEGESTQGNGKLIYSFKDNGFVSFFSLGRWSNMGKPKPGLKDRLLSLGFKEVTPKEDYNRLNMPTFLPNKINVSIGNPLGGHDQRDQDDLSRPSGLKVIKRIKKKRPMIHGKDKYRYESLNKEPWEMTQEEWVNEYQNIPRGDYANQNVRASQARDTSINAIKKLKELKWGVPDYDIIDGEQYRRTLGEIHKEIIKKALSLSKPVPPEVLKDHPELSKKEDLEKASWQMTQAEYIKKEMSNKRKRGVVGSGRFGGAKGLRTEEEKWHRLLVKDAFEKGKPVPPEVLAEYPDLIKHESLGTNYKRNPTVRMNLVTMIGMELTGMNYTVDQARKLMHKISQPAYYTEEYLRSLLNQLKAGEIPDILKKQETLGTPIGGAGHPIHAFSGNIGGYEPKYDVVKDNSSVAKDKKSTGKKGKINPKLSKYLKNKTETVPVNKAQKIISLYEKLQ